MTEKNNENPAILKEHFVYESVPDKRAKAIEHKKCSKLPGISLH